MGSGTKRLLVAEGPLTAFFSYCREDSDFALRLAGDLKAAGASVWLDQLDIIPGQRWDRAVEDALAICPRMLVILSPISVDSTNVMDEVSFALEEKKTVIPVIYRDCAIPFRLRRVQYVDFRQDYARGLKELLKTLVPEQRIGQSKSAISDVPGQLLTDVAEPDSHECAAEGEPRKTVQDSKVAEQARVDQEPQQAAKREGFDQELKRTEQRHLPNKAQNATVRARLEEDRKPAAEQTQKDQGHEQAAASSPASKLLLGLATLGVALSLGVLGTVPINYFGFLPVGVALVVLVALVSWRMVWRKQITWPRMLAASLFMALAMIAVETLFSGLFRVGGYYFHTYIVHLLFTCACIGMLQAVFCASLTRKDVFVPASRLLLGLATIGIALVVETALAVLTVFSTRVEGFSIVRTLVLVQPEMEKTTFSASEYSALRAGFSRHGDFRSNGGWAAQERVLTPRHPDHRLDEPPGYPSAWLHPCRARFRFARQGHCSFRNVLPFLNIRFVRDSAEVAGKLEFSVFPLK